MVELRAIPRQLPELRLAGATTGEFAERFVAATKGRDAEAVAVMVWFALERQQLAAEQLREQAATLVEKHAIRLGLDLFAGKAIAEAIRALPVSE